MYSVRLVDEYSKVIFNYKKNHKNKKKYKISMFISLIVIIGLILCLSFYLSDTFINENFLELFVSGCVVLSSLMLVADEIFQKMYFYQKKDKEQIFYEISNWIKKNIPDHSLKTLDQLIDSELEHNSKNYLTFIVITGALTLAVWQGFTRGILTEVGLFKGLLLLLIAVLILNVIVFTFNKVTYFISHIMNFRLKYLKELNYIIKEHMIRMDKLQNEKGIYR
ncbi:hypothetical protein ACTWP4_18710 [Gracilibacillus sp. D59]|uniref:hypothetical protein n=1 Tax=Gracilibacillus sp. D59 TaxID=3457434 RepID=UPI003FCDD90C